MCKRKGGGCITANVANDLSMTIQSTSVGVLGMGIIGSRVAENLRKAGHEVFVWSPTPRPLPGFLGSPLEVASAAQVIQIFVRDGEALLDVLEQMQPALEGHHLVMNHATVSPSATREAAEICAASGSGFLDAPFTGSKMAAQQGKLVYYIGGASQWLERARPVLEASSSQILLIGEVADASLVKITTNLVSAVIIKALTEAAAITQKHGVPLERLLEALQSNANFSPLIGMKLPAMIAGDFDPHFSLKNMLKDADFARDLAREAGIDATVLEATAAAMRLKLDEGKGDFDFSVIGEGLSTTE